MTESVGRLLTRSGSVDALLETEARAGRADRFARIHQLAAAVLSTSLSGSPPVVFDGNQDATLRLERLASPDRASVDELFDLATQQAKGAWWLPESTTLKAGCINLPAYHVTAARWAANTAAADNRRVTFSGCPDALACWALLAPFAETLTAPLLLRGPDAGTLEPEARASAWAAVDDSYTALGLRGNDIQSALNTMRPGNGWSRMRAAQQIEARQVLVAALAASVQPSTVARWRATQLRPLLNRFYTKAKKTAPTAQAVLTKPLQRTLAAFFASDWLALLDYLEEQPASGERIATVLPQPRLYVEASAKVERVAAQKNLPVDDVARMLASYLGTEEIRSPIERRVTLLQEYWQLFDAAHAAQRPAMRPLASLVSERWLEQGERVPFLTPVYEELLPPRMLADIDTLWGTECDPRHPERIVSALYTHARLGEAFGPALTFWHNVALTAWYLCEGPYARTDLDGSAEYYARDTGALADAGTPVPTELFADLKAAEHRLGAPEQIAHRERYETPEGLSLEFSISRGERRDGFEILRDVITRHRRAWASQHLDNLLRRRWEEALLAASREFNRIIAGKGKPPTVKQFARTAQSTLNSWFGGDLTALYVAIGETPPAPQRRNRLLPHDRAAFCNRVFEALGGRYVANSDAGSNPGYADSWARMRLAMEAPRFVQLEELLDRQPDPKEFRAQNFTWPDGLTFEHFAQIVERVRATLPTARPSFEKGAQASLPSAATPTMQRPGPIEQVPPAQPSAASALGAEVADTLSQHGEQRGNRLIRRLFGTSR